MTDRPPDLTGTNRALRQVVKDYYSSITDRDYESAWARLSSDLREQYGGYDYWVEGHKTTSSVSPDHITARATSLSRATVMFSVTSEDRDACGHNVSQLFKGAWTLARPAGTWIIKTSRVEKVAGGTPVLDAAKCPAAKPSETRAPASPHSPKGTGQTDETEVCFPGFSLPAVDLPPVDLPPVTIPATTINGQRYPARRIPGRHIAGRHIPGRRLPRTCLKAPRAFAPQNSTILDDAAYPHLDAGYSPTLTTRLWGRSGSSINVPDYSAPGFGEFNAAGFPRNQFVRSYVRRDGTFVHSYWRNSSSDGLPTCRIITC